MSAVSDAGCKVHILSLWPPTNDHSGHPVEIPFLDRVMYSGYAGNMKRMIRAIIKRPSVLFTFLQLLTGHLRSPWLLGKLLLCYPRGLIAGSYAEEIGCDLIHAHFLTTPTTVAFIASKVSGIPYTATAHAFDITSTHPKLVNGSVALKCKHASAIITISEYNRKDILSRWPSISDVRLEVIYNGIDTSKFAPRNTDTEKPLIKSTPYRIISISNLNEKKGFTYLISAVNKLLDKGVDISLEIYGDGPQREQLEEQIKQTNHENHIRLCGSIDQSEVEQLCKTADLFVLASILLPTGDADGLPTVLIESLGSELPSISTQVTGIPEIIIDQVTGLCVSPADSEKLAEAIAWCVENPSQAQSMARAGRMHVLKYFDQKNTSQQLMKVWSEILNDRDNDLCSSDVRHDKSFS